MKKLFATCLASLLLAGAAPAFADAAPAQPAHDAPSTAEARAAGSVSRYVVSPTGHVRGFVLGDDVVVLLHGREGDTMAKEVPIGQAVQVEARTRPGAPKTLFHASVYGQHGQVVDASIGHDHKKLDTAERKAMWERRREELAKLSPLSTQGTIKTVLTGRHGAPSALLLTNGATVFLPPSLVRALGSRTLRAGQPVTVSGRGGTYPLGLSIEASELVFPDGARVAAETR